MKQSLRLGLRALVLTSLSLLAVPAMGQNIQLHYDFGRYLYPKVQADRPRMTMTVEQQSLDRFGRIRSTSSICPSSSRVQ